ncbi:MAG: type II toxin-antitoxin system HicB family antitoxin [Thermoleophilia bacterium]
MAPLPTPGVFTIELEPDTDGRWIGEVVEIPGVLVYGATKDEATAHVQALALRVVADRLEHHEARGELLGITFIPA